MADAMESLGFMVFRVSQEAPIDPIMQAEWAIFTGYPTSITRFESWRKTHKTVVWTLDWVPDHENRRYIVDAAKEATLFLSSDQFDWKSLGVKTHGYLPGACEPSSVPFDPKPTIPCAFIGLVYSKRRERIVRIVKNLGGVVLDNQGLWRYGKELSKFVQTVKVVVGDNFRNDVPGYWSTRNYIVPGAGGFLLTPRVPKLELQFALDKEIAVYDSIDDLEGKLSSWIVRDEAREEVRRSGYIRAHSEHHWQARAETLAMHLTAGTP